MFNATPLVRDTPPHSSRTTARKARSVHPLGYRFNFDQFWQRYEIDCPTFVQPIEPESPRIHPSRIEIFDRLIFHPDRARRMRAPRFALDRCRQFCCIRWTVSSDREYVYIYIFFLSFFFHPPSSSPLPSPHVNLKRVRGKRDNEPRCLIRAKLGGIWNMREGRKWLDSPPIQRIDGWKGIDGGDRWFFLFLFSFLPPDI